MIPNIRISVCQAAASRRQVVEPRAPPWPGHRQPRSRRRRRRSGQAQNGVSLVEVAAETGWQHTDQMLRIAVKRAGLTLVNRPNKVPLTARL